MRMAVFANEDCCSGWRRQIIPHVIRVGCGRMEIEGSRNGWEENHLTKNGIERESNERSLFPLLVFLFRCLASLHFRTFDTIFELLLVAVQLQLDL